ncbi:MAG: UDP-N-acetylmuramate--L-alanine ligase [Bacteroidales bacterium]|jgi:UDP-N-acetylmuramate--alanine ligase|nr:UDP-N-acetylmuramate--L-alanine ligase [Bacteroidales bacterium]
MDIKTIHNVYFLGVGGIGMSAIARYFNTLGKNVAGYDKVSKPLTDELISEGIEIHFEDDVSNIPASFKDKPHTLVVYTPAIPKNHKELNYFIQEGFKIKKRSEVLGMLSREKQCIAVAGTHGKTTITTMIAHLMRKSRMGCNAFLGGISTNYNTNFLVDSESKYVVVEADEFDRSFLQLNPQKAIISSVDADHLDIFSDENDLKEAFKKFINQINPGGTLIIKENLVFDIPERSDIEIYTYSLNKNSDFKAENIHVENGLYVFDFVGVKGRINNLKLGLPGLLNVDNAIAAIAMATLAGVHNDEIFNSLKKFKGIQRRFDYQIQRNDFVYIDDYAHHPEELKASIHSAKELFSDKKITGIFQPHLYTRTRDFSKGFAESLELLDEIILLDIYPAREKSIPGITSEIIFNKISNKNKILCKKTELLDVLKNRKPEVLMTFGAGDIDELVEPIKKLYKKA